MTGKLRGVRTLREKAEALVAAELAASLFRKRRRVQRILVSPQIFHLLGTEPEWRELIELDSELEGMICAQRVQERGARQSRNGC